jgi:hypothetical protein
MLGIEIIKRFGGGAGTPALADDAVFGTRYSQWTIAFDGFTYKRKTSGAATKEAAWINPQSGMDKYEVRATDTGSDTPVGTIGSWLPMSASYTWGWATEDNPKNGELLIEIRTAVGHVTVDSATITIVNSGTL